MMRVHQYTMLCAPHMAQIAAIEALDSAEGEVAEMVADYDRRRRFFVQRPEPDRAGLRGAERRVLCVSLHCSEPGLTSEEFAERLLMEERVAVVPGGAFGPSGAGSYPLLLCDRAMPSLEEALERMGRFVARHSDGTKRPRCSAGKREAFEAILYFRGACIL